MKVITIKQPWATLIAEGIKIYEFRTWNTKYRGEILIHAGKGVDKNAMEIFKDYNFNYPQGCIIAKAKITNSIIVDSEFIKELELTNLLVYKNIINNPEWKRYAFKLENVEKIAHIHINGRLSLWNYEN